MNERRDSSERGTVKCETDLKENLALILTESTGSDNMSHQTGVSTLDSKVHIGKKNYFSA